MVGFFRHGTAIFCPARIFGVPALLEGYSWE
jgi:hypothetical protein